LVYSTKLTPSQDNVAAKPRGDWGGGYTEFAGFVVVHYKTEASTGGDGIQVCREASRRGTRGGIAGLVLDGSKTAAKVCPPDGNIHYLTKVPLRGAYLPFKL
jgi:hypothetical protein